MNQHKSFDPAFLVFLLLNATLILRPGELVPALAEAPIYEMLIVTAAVLAHRRILQQLSWQALTCQPVTLCVLGLLVAAVLSHLTHMYLFGAKESGTLFVKTLIYYVLLVAVIDSPEKLRKFLLAVTLITSVMVAMCVADYLSLVEIPFIKHIVESDGVTITNEAFRLTRMRGTGIFSDPNDISLLIVAAGVMGSYFLFDRRRGPGRFLWLIPLTVLVVGLYCTHSRGGLLAAGAAGMVLILSRYGWKPAFALVVLGVVMMSLVGGRQGSIDLESGTGQERIRLWRDGLVAIQSPDLIFGIGVGLYTDVAELVAHNSFVHAYVEMGLFGGTFFFGCFFFSALALYRMRKYHVRLRDPELVRLYPFVAAVLAGWCVGMLSLSRCYVIPTYMIIGIAAAYVRLVRWRSSPPQNLVQWDSRHIVRLAAGSAALFVFLFVFTITFAR